MTRTLAIFVLLPLALSAQMPVIGRLLDPSGAPVAGVTVTLRQNDSGLSAVTSEAGQFRFDNVRPGEYEVLTSVPGFDPIRRQLRVGRLPARELVIRLKIAVLREELNVAAQDRQISVAPGQNADAISVERTMLDNLPILDNNYLSALARFLNPGTPGDAGTSLIVDGMESRNVGMTASAIQEIRINNNPYTVEYPRWSRRRIEVITKSSADSYITEPSTSCFAIIISTRAMRWPRSGPKNSAGSSREASSVPLARAITRRSCFPERGSRTTWSRLCSLNRLSVPLTRTSRLLR